MDIKKLQIDGILHFYYIGKNTIYLMYSFNKDSYIYTLDKKTKRIKTFRCTFGKTNYFNKWTKSPLNLIAKKYNF